MKVTRSRETGQVMILGTMFMAVLIGFAGLALDVGEAYVKRQDMQKASDAAVLAAAGILRGGGSIEAAIEGGTEIAAANGYADGLNGHSVDVAVPPVSGPHAGDPMFAEVSIDGDSPAYFTRAFAFEVFPVDGRAVAGSNAVITEGAAPRALFSLQTTCNAADLGIAASSVNVVGGVHSNSNITVSGSNNSFTGGDNTRVCNLTNSGSGNVYDPPFVSGPVLPDPLGYEYSDVPCTMSFIGDTDLGSVASAWVNNNPASNYLKPGVYCSTGKLTLSRSDVTGNVTLVAHNQISISGSRFNLTPFWENVLLFTDFNDDSAMDLSGSDGNWEGYIYAPKGKAKLNGSANLTVRGAVVAEKIEVSGSGLTIDSTDFDSGEDEEQTGPLRLVE